MSLVRSHVCVAAVASAFAWVACDAEPAAPADDVDSTHRTQEALTNPIANPGFETPSLGNGYQYGVTGASWAFESAGPTGGSGESGNGSGFTIGNPNAPQGTQVAFIQGAHVITQSVPFSAGNYTLTFKTAQRAGNSLYASLNVFVDSTQVLSLTGDTNTSYVLRTTSSFALAAGNHTIKFQGVNPNGADNTIFIDDVQVQAVEPTTIRTITAPATNLTVADLRPQFPVIYNGWNAQVRWMGNPGSAEQNGEVANPITWDVGVSTGLHPPTPYSNYQRGYYPGSSPFGNAFQTYHGDFGSLINTDYFTHTVPIAGGGQNAVLTYTYSAPVTPWQHANGHLVIKGKARIPTSWTSGGGYGQMSYQWYLLDTVSGKAMSWVAQLYDTRPAPQNNQQGTNDDGLVTFWDNVTRHEYGVAVPIRAGKTYGHPETAPSVSNTMANGGTWGDQRFFSIHISANELMNVVADLNRLYGAGLSTTPKAGCSFAACNYALMEAGTLHETFVDLNSPPQQTVQMGVDASNVGIYEYY